jgi:hypothetical protein
MGLYEQQLQSATNDHLRKIEERLDRLIEALDKLVALVERRTWVVPIDSAPKEEKR